MALSVRNRQVEELARLLSYERGITITEALLEALRARLQQLGPESRLARDTSKMEQAARRIAAMPVLRNDNADDIIGYDADGLPA